MIVRSCTKKNITLVSKSSREIPFKNKSFFYRKDNWNAIYFWVIVQRRHWTTFHAKQQNVGSKVSMLVIENNFSEKGGILGHKLSRKQVWDIDDERSPSEVSMEQIKFFWSLFHEDNEVVSFVRMVINRDQNITSCKNICVLIMLVRIDCANQ